MVEVAAVEKAGGGAIFFYFFNSIGAGFRTDTNKIETKVPTNRCRLGNRYL